MDSAKLADALSYIRQRQLTVHSLLVIRNGYIVLDAYFYPYDRAHTHDVASVTKSITAALIGIAIDGGQIQSVQQPVLSLLPERRVANREARKERLTVEHLVTMSSGLDCQYEPGEPTLSQMRQSDDWVQFMLDLPMVAEPGERFLYCSGGMHLLSGLISRTTGKSALEFARERLIAPLGVGQATWPADRLGISHGWGDLHLHPHDMAKIGYLWLNRGMWAGQRVVSAQWVDASTRPQASTGQDNDYSYGWWVKTRGEPFVYEAVGRGGQRIAVVPDKNLVVVMTGGGFEPGDFSHLLLEAIRSDQPLPINRGGFARLAAALASAGEPPAAQTAPELPRMARAVSGKAYQLAANPLGLKSLTLKFASRTAATARLTFADGRALEHPIGLDGRIKRSGGGRYNLPVGVKGHWEKGQEFILDYDEIANINRLRFRMRFDGDRVSIQMAELTSNYEVMFEGESAGK